MTDRCSDGCSIAAADPEACERAVDDFVDKLRQVCGQATIEFALRVGQLLIESFYGGDVSRWRKRGRADASLKRLTARSDLPLSLPQLYRCVAIYEISLELPAFSTWKYLSVSHVRAVLGLPREAQENLLCRADQERWTVLRIEREVRTRRNEIASRRGRPPRSEHQRQLASLESWLEKCPDSLDATLADYIDTLGVAALQTRIAIVRSRLTHLQDALNQMTATSVDDRDTCRR